MQELVQSRAPLDRLAAIGVSGQQHGLVVLDESHHIIRPAKLWNDTSTQTECHEIIGAAGGLDSYRSEIGNPLPPGFTASKIRWLKKNEPENYRRVRSILLPHEFLNFYLTGQHRSEPGDSSGTGYFRVKEREWSQRALGWIDPDRDLQPLLGELMESSQPTGQLRPELCQRWGTPGDVIVSSGGGDNMMGAIGTGNVKGGTLTVSLGTSGTLYAYTKLPVWDPSAQLSLFCDSTGGWLPLGCTMNVTVATEMVRRNFMDASLRQFEDSAANIPPGSGGLILLPYLEGERTPNVPQGTGVLMGLTPSTATPAHLARSAMEGVTLGLRYVLEVFRSLKMTPREAILIGGGARSDLWRQICADVFALPVVCPEITEGPAFGAALQALWCHQGDSIEALTSEHVRLDETTRKTPVPARQGIYDKIYLLYEKLSAEMSGNDLFKIHRLLVSQLKDPVGKATDSRPEFKE